MKIVAGRAVLATTGLALVVFAGACAKRPVVPVASAPAPTPQPAVEAPPAVAAVSPPPAAPAPVTAPAPAPPPAPRSTPPSEFRSNDGVKVIHFEFDRSTIRPNDAKILDANAAWLKANPTYLLLIEGHCDERGTNEYNVALGERRAAAAMQYLAAAGVRSDRMSLTSYGEERPVCTAHKEACWAQNRRAEFLVKEQ